MGRYELLTFATPLALAQAAAEAWLTEIQSANLKRPYCVALSGGRIARQFFSELADRAKKRAVSLEDVHFFWADERCVPPSDVESNFALAEKWLFGPLHVPPHQ